MFAPTTTYRRGDLVIDVPSGASHSAAWAAICGTGQTRSGGAANRSARSGGQAQLEAPAVLRDRHDVAAGRPREAPRERQAEARTAGFADPGLEDPLGVGRVDPRAVVEHGEDDRAVVAR